MTGDGPVFDGISSCRTVDQITTMDKKYELVARMADSIVEIFLESGDCVQQNLQTKGFTHHDVVSLWHFANVLSAIELRLHTKGPSFSLENVVQHV